MLKKCLTMVLIVLFLFVSGLNAQDNNKLLEGITHYYEGSYQEAISSFGEIMEDNQVNIDALYYQTLAYLEEHNIIEARNNIRIMEDAGYKFGIIHWKLGSLYLNKDGYYDSAFYNEARKELEKSQELGIYTSGLHSDLAMAYQGLGNLEKAVTEYEIAIEKGTVAEDYINLANLYQQTGKISDAMEIYELAIKENHENISIYLNMGTIFIENEEYARAVEVLKKGTDLRPNFVALRRQLAIAYYHNQEYDHALKEFETIIEQNPNIYEAYYYMALIYEQVKGEPEKAIDYYEQAINYNSSYVRAYIALGDLYLAQGNSYQAIAQYMSALENNPNYSVAHYHLALAYEQLGMKEAAIEQLRRTLHIDSGFEDARKMLDKLLKE